MTRTFTMSGLSLVSLGACESGKRLFLSKIGVRDPRRLGDAELDLLTATSRLTFPPRGEVWDEQRWVEVWIEAAKTGFLGWLINAKLWFELDVGAPAVQEKLVALLADGDGYVRQAAAQALAAQAGSPAVQEKLVALLADGVWYVRQAAAQALAAQAELAPAVQAALEKAGLAIQK